VYRKRLSHLHLQPGFTSSELQTKGRTLSSVLHSFIREEDRALYQQGLASWLRFKNKSLRKQAPTEAVVELLEVDVLPSYS
jgi:hypothetical protein